MSKAVRKSGGIVVTCDACGSEGTSPATRVRVDVPEDRRQQAIELASAKQVVINDHNRAVADIDRRFAISRDDDRAEMLRKLEGKRAALSEQFKKTSAAMTDLPQPDLSARSYVDACPWCGSALGVEIEEAVDA